ncbi:hypothetical protein CYMTET_29019 [Cymbomonas tetramitiformis]|uniref:Uncharacterized protein n=1 Tax=Cymbomonas tetramitiformis TaxID=36881 RepID=A0AAE0FM34_9CHLO|nr:hypothetical protein CYMTET_29019 [Cymbomonas tetramitiformis]
MEEDECTKQSTTNYTTFSDYVVLWWTRAPDVQRRIHEFEKQLEHATSTLVALKESFEKNDEPLSGFADSHRHRRQTDDWKRNVAPEMEQKGADLYVQVKGDFHKGRCALTENNTIAKADMFRRFKMKRGFPSFKSTVLHCRVYLTEFRCLSSIPFVLLCVRRGVFVVVSHGIHNNGVRMSQTILAVHPFEGNDESDIDEGFQFSGFAATYVTRNREQEVAAAADRRPSGIVFNDDDGGPVTMTDGPVTVGTPAAKDVAPVELQSPPKSSAQAVIRHIAKIAEQASFLKIKGPEVESDTVHAAKRQLILGTREVLSADEWEVVENSGENDDCRSTSEDSELVRKPPSWYKTFKDQMAYAK